MGGGPWAIFDKGADNVLVFSALDEFMITSPVFDKSESRICHGVMATVEKIPQLYTFRSILYHGKNGINEVPFQYQITNPSILRILHVYWDFLYRAGSCCRLFDLGVSFFVSTTTRHQSTAIRTSSSTTWGTGQTVVHSISTTLNRIWTTKKRFLQWRKIPMT